MTFTTDGYRDPHSSAQMQSNGLALTKDTETVDCESLPRLLYFADVPVENYMHGSTLLYRLLDAYPKDKLVIIEGNIRSDTARRIDGVTSHQCKPSWARLLRTRFSPYLSPV